ncbi:TPM domain-containing protein [Emticicia sp. SJ17W-69]|uniref:TPM domain-containing protein n=1 Tax=Emticicia sp. SJ17W-69 TaxID=3421657 RepID=UPI003EBC30E5
MLKKLFIFLFFLQNIASAQDIPQKPNPARFVNDFVGGLLNQGQIDQLEQKLRAYQDSTSTQVAIVIVKSVQPYDINEYAVKLGRAWGIGQKDKNNGILLLWAPSDRKIYIATGYGAEGGLTDARSKRIIEQTIKPRFKQLQYYEGLNAAIDDIIKYESGEFEADPAEDEGDGWVGIIIFLILIAVVIYFMRKSGGGRGGRGGGFVPYTTYTGWGSSSGGWSGGSSSGGGGGFDFGGGSFGGGGAGGDY